jgi:ArsR family transcriptional regulator, virulence genes transcriptional regulator
MRKPGGTRAPADQGEKKRKPKPAGKADDMHDAAAAACELLKALSNETRLLILCHLIEGEKSVGELEQLLDARQPHVSQQLARLRADGLVSVRRDSRHIFYRLGSPEVEQVLETLHAIYCSPAAKRARRAAAKPLAKSKSAAE